MVKFNAKLMSILLITLYIISCALFAYDGSKKLMAAEDSIHRYTELLNRLEASRDEDPIVLERLITQLEIELERKKANTDKDRIAKGGSEALARQVRDAAIQSGLTITRYQPSSLRSQIEFSLQGTPYAAVLFLRAAMDRNWTIPYLSIRNSQSLGVSDITIRISHE